MSDKHYEARSVGGGAWRMYKDGKPTQDVWTGEFAEESAKIYEAFWNTPVGDAVRTYGYYNAVQKGLIPPGGNVPRDIQQRLREVLSKPQEQQPIQHALWEE